jgi:SnoaL-like polyketide cyclase
MWQAHRFRRIVQRIEYRLVSQLLSSIFDSRMSMILKAFSGRSAIPRVTTMSPGGSIIRAGTESAPDLEIEVLRRHVAEDAILVEVMIRGTHLGGWRGLPATRRRVEFPLCGVYTFDADDSLAGERIYYDRGTVLRQLGVFYEPQSILGQISILATHPATIARAFARNLLRK